MFRVLQESAHRLQVKHRWADLMFEADGAIDEDREARRPTDLLLNKFARALYVPCMRRGAWRPRPVSESCKPWR
jgi:hypothetical protein